MSDQAAIVDLLSPHWRTDCSESLDGTYVRWVRCRCGWESEKSRTLVNIPQMHWVWNTHLADVLTGVLS